MKIPLALSMAIDALLFVDPYDIGYSAKECEEAVAALLEMPSEIWDELAQLTS